VILPIPVLQKWCLFLIALGIPLSAIGAIYPGNTWLQAGPVAAGLPLAALALRRWPISNASAGCLAAFVLLHLLAARWSYSFVPYHTWLTALGGADFAQHFATGRNMFDRLVHGAFGMLCAVPILELTMRYGHIGRRAAAICCLMFVAAIGGLYEIFEWSLTMALSPEAAGAYNGEQGDIFDSQKDMAIAVLGCVLIMPLALRRQRGPA